MIEGGDKVRCNLTMQHFQRFYFTFERMSLS